MSIAELIWTKIKNLPTQPCCGYFLHGGTRVVGLLDFGLALFASIFIASEIYQNFHELELLYERNEFTKYYCKFQLVKNWEKCVHIKRETRKWHKCKICIILRLVRAASWTSYFTYNVVLLGLSIFLFKAAKKRSSRLCKIWMVLSSLTNIALVCTYYVNHHLFNLSKTVHVFIVFFVTYKLYCLHVVWSFIREIESYGGFNAALSGLTDAEVEEFEKGCPPDTLNNSGGLLVENRGFNKDFEIRAENLEIDKLSILGSGAFGCVYRGKLTNELGTKSVAVKTVNPNADVAYFKTLLSELKVMTYVSNHENVVGLIGACTSNIKEKKLYVVVEFCPFGNLHDYLKARRGLFVNFVKDGVLTINLDSAGKLGYENLNTGNTVTTIDILKWMHDSSKGLEFLEEKKVIHGDIAARNILLAYGKIAKISDFGLAKKLYQYTSVIKEEMLLPWRWLAVEVLTDMEFSTKSDVWSFATTMWEAFSLSELPFPGFNWNKDCVSKVCKGLCMNQPRNAPNEIYALMVKCWQPLAIDRPSFKEVRIEVEQMLNNVTPNIAVENISEGDTNNQSSKNVEEIEEIEVYIPNQLISNACTATVEYKV